jgi:hypothetical protein
MMGRLDRDQGQQFYSFSLDDAVPDDHPVREIAAVLNLSWVHAELVPYYPRLGRPSIDPALIIRMLIVGYLFAIGGGKFSEVGGTESSPILTVAKSGLNVMGR